MRKAEHADKGKVISILTESFFDNKSVNYIVQNDEKIKDRIRYLMEYSFEQCLLAGEVYISDDGNGCALVQYFDRKKTSLDTVMLDVKLILKSVGIRNVAKVLKRESTIKKNYPHDNIAYLWFIGVDPEKQGRGIGSKMLAKIVEQNRATGRDVFLETSTQKNLPWYQKHGFKIYNEITDFGFPFYFLKNTSPHPEKL